MHLDVFAEFAGSEKYVFTTWTLDVWLSTRNTRVSTAQRLCSSRTDSRATGAGIDFNTAHQQAAVVWSRFAGIIRRLGYWFFFFLWVKIGILDLLEANLKGIFVEDTGLTDVKRQAFYSSFAIWFFLPVKCCLYLTDAWLQDCSLQVCIPTINVLCGKNQAKQQTGTRKERKHCCRLCIRYTWAAFYVQNIWVRIYLQGWW